MASAEAEVLPALRDRSSSPLTLWERQTTDTDKSWEAFEVYRGLGAQRSLLKVGQQLGKSTALLSRWSALHNWVIRAQAWDRHEARTINERILLGTAEMRSRMVNQALSLQARAQARILKMSDTEIAALRPNEVVALMRAGSDIERRARDIDPNELGFAPDIQPKFEITVIRPGGMVGVQLADGRSGYIPHDSVERFRRENPDAVVIL
jgi:hypothetical protein